LCNSYRYTGTGPGDWRIEVPKAKALAKLREVTVSGRLVPKELARIAAGSATRRYVRDPNGYIIEPLDGDIHFQLGARTARNGHVGCELQNATASELAAFGTAVGKAMTVGGFFRCLFEHPGFQKQIADAHIFEIHPVRLVDPLAGKARSFDVDIPKSTGIHLWVGQHIDCNALDGGMSVSYARKTDTLTFRGMIGEDKNYVQIAGTASTVSTVASDLAATFTFTSPDTRQAHEVTCLSGTRALRQLRGLPRAGGDIWLIAVRGIDLTQALAGRYAITLLAIDIRARSSGPAVQPASLCPICLGLTTVSRTSS
jgi:hypothetical protein